LPAEKGVDTDVGSEPVATESEAGGVEAQIDSKPVEATASVPEREAPATPDVPASRQSSVRPQASVDLGFDEPVAVAVASTSNAESFAIRHWRTIAIAAAVTLFLVAGLFSMRSKHTQTRSDKPAVPTKMGEIQLEHVAPVVVSNPAIAASEAAATRPATTAEIGAPEPVRPAAVSGAQAESFSDAFVKHAATVNSSWAEVKKRPKAVESSQSNKPVAAGNAKANDSSPLDVLDKLEKARKAKKSAGK
jgi:hypothetical protein